MMPIIIKKKLQKKICEFCFPSRSIALDQCQDVAKECRIIVDECNKDCIRGRELADSLLQIIKTNKAAHQGKNHKNLLPLQGCDYWHKWAEKDKEQYHQKKRRSGTTTVNEYSALQKREMKICEEQVKFIQTSKSELFISTLTKYRGQPNVLDYFLQWMELFLNVLSREELNPLYTQYKAIRNKLHGIEGCSTISPWHCWA